MAGVQAGSAFNVTIDFVAKMVSLQNDMEKLKRTVRDAGADVARTAKAANDNLAGIGRGAGAGMQQFSREVARIKAQLDPTWASLQRYKNELSLLSQAYRQGAITQEQYTQGLARARTGWQQAGSAVTRSAGAQRAGMQQLSYQLGDVATMWSMGAKPMQIFASQSGQVVQAVSLMTNGSKGLLGVLGGPWGMVLSAAVVALAPLISKLFDAKDALDDVGDAAQRAMQKLRQSLSEVSNFQAALTENGNKVINSMGAVARAEREIASITRLMNEMATTPGGAQAMEGLNKRLQQAQAARDQAQKNLDDAKASLDEIRMLRNVEEIQSRNQARFSQAAESASRERRAGLSAEAKALNQANEATQSYIQGLQDEIARIGLNEKAIRQLEVAKAREAAVTDAQRKKIDELNDARERAIEQQQLLARIKEADDASAKLREETAAIERQAKAIGLQGWERERFLLLLQREAELRPLLTKLAQAQTLSTDAEAQAIQRQIDALNEKYRASVKAGNLSEVFRQEQEEARALDDALRDIIGSLQQIGGFGGVIGGLLGILTGNTGAIRGPIGDLLNIGVDIDPLTKQVRKLGDVLKDAIGGLGSKMVGALQAAGTGIMAGAAAFGQQGMGGMIASGAGGILGSIGGSMLSGTISSAIGGALGSAIGSAVPVIGTILGGLAGGAIAKLLGGTKRGSAIISGGGVSGFYGNSGKMKDQAGDIAGSLLDTLQQIADQFGTTLDAQAMGKISIGVRDGKYAVDTLGRGYTKSSIAGVKSFGTDADAAVEYALKTLLDRGAIAMREGSMKIIKEAADLQEGLTRALQFEQIMNELEGGNSQLVTQVRAIRSQFQQYISVMKQAGASVTDLTRVQEMQVQRINQLIAQAGDSYRSTFYTDSQNVAFAQQQIHAVLDPLGKGAIDTVAEYMAAVEAAQKDTSEAGLAWLETLYGLSDEFGVLKAAAEAAAAAAAAAKAQKEAEAAAAAAERERQAQERQRAIEAAQDVLRQAFEREAGQLQETIDKFDQLGKSLREFRDSLTDTVSSTANAAKLLAKFKEIGRMAALGDAEAMGNLAGAGKDYLAAAKARASSFEEYQRAVALVRRTVDGAIGAADAGKSVAEEQLAQLKAQVGQLIDLNAGVVSVAKAIEELRKLTAGTSGSTPTTPNKPTTPGTNTNNPGGSFGGTPRDRLADRLAEAEARRQEMQEKVQSKQNEREDRTDKRLEVVEERLAEQTPVLKEMARGIAASNRFWDRMSPNGVALATVPVE